ncbi:hypothetical protein [Bdellovibrio bacteriovorus]|uniref:hypothetical protein n=1 Tax=Bdellovibrio bacteriovorus TaxID=959 RepID=UPI0035A9427F
MKSWHKYFVALIAVVSFHFVHAQEESAPQEPPFVQEENEFDTLPGSEQTPDEAEALSIEDEIQSAEPEAKPKKETVNLNEQAPDSGKKLEEELLLEEETQTPVVEEPSVVPAEPVVEVKPTPKRARSSDVVQRSTKGGVEYIHHPQAAKGLIAITKDGSYIYRTKETGTFDQTGSFKVGMMDPPRITAADGTTFEMMYSDGQQPVMMFDYEWQPFNGYGKLGLQAGFGIMVANGNGRFVDPSMSALTPKEKYTFVAFPLSIGAVYRLEWMSRQWLAPYVAGGGTYIAVAEFRDDGKSPSAVGTPGAYGAAGMLFNISAINRETAFTLRSEYGIANLWVSLDYRYLSTFNEDLDFSSNIVGAGIVVDY